MNFENQQTWIVSGVRGLLSKVTTKFPLKSCRKAYFDKKGTFLLWEITDKLTLEIIRQEQTDTLETYVVNYLEK